jgi:hypothetical protein
MAGFDPLRSLADNLLLADFDSGHFIVLLKHAGLRKL